MPSSYATNDPLPESGALGAALREIRATLRQLTGLTYLPEHPPEIHPRYPALDVYADRGEWRKGTGASGRTANWSARHGQQTIAAGLMSARADLPTAIAELEPYLDLVPAALFRRWAKDQFGETVQELVSVSWDWADGERGSDQVAIVVFSIAVVLADEVPEPE